MLSKEHNELLTRTGPETPMGELIRRYWIPALLSEEIPAPDCPPARVRILGEALVAFRDSAGKIGLLEEHCLHRGTSLFFGRNEVCGLRCIYHGWKYDVDGNVLDTPAQPAGNDTSPDTPVGSVLGAFMTIGHLLRFATLGLLCALFVANRASAAAPSVVDTAKAEGEISGPAAVRPRSTRA